MKIFLCWSGDRSRHVAKAFDSFLRDLNAKLELTGNLAFDPFRSANIEKGLPWFQAVENELASAEAALVSITPENCTSPWMHYEAGAVANGMRIAMSQGPDQASAETLQGRLFTYLFGMNAGDLRGPLAAYQSTAATYDDTRALVRRLLALAKVPLPTDEQAAKDTGWERKFRTCWNTFVEHLRPCRHQQLPDVIADFAAKFHRLTFKEPVALCHRQAWTDRIKGCNQVFTDLQCRNDEVKKRCRPFQADLYDELLTALDGYEMTMQAYLVADKPFDLGKQGKLMMDDDTEWVCENRRHVVLQAMCDLLDPQTAPIFDESAAFARMETFPEKKNAIHRKKADMWRFLQEKKEAATRDNDPPLDSIPIAELDPPPALPPIDDFKRALQSSWDFDRAIYYLTHAESIRHDLPEEVAKQCGICTRPELQDALLRWLSDEVEMIRAKHHLPPQIPQEPSRHALADRNPGASAPASQDPAPAEPSRIPMYYALGVLEELVTSREQSKDPTPPLDAPTLEKYKALLREVLELESELVSQVRTRVDSISRRIDTLGKPVMPRRQSPTARPAWAAPPKRTKPRGPQPAGSVSKGSRRAPRG